MSPEGFKNVLKKNRYKNYDTIYSHEIHSDKKSLKNGYRTNVKRGFAQGINSCTAGVCVNKGKKASLFWQVKDTFANVEKFL